MKNNKTYQYNFSESSNNVYDVGNRLVKARKTIAVLSDYIGNLSGLNLLDIGCSAGIMTKEYAKFFNTVTGIDIDKKAIDYALENNKSENTEYLLMPIEENRFKENSFDVITCSHIYEHVPSDTVLMDHIFNILKPGGVCYFAAGNKYKIIEPHYNLPFLSFFPKKIADIYIRLFKSETEYYEKFRSHRKLKKLITKFELIDYTLEIISNPKKYSSEDILKNTGIRYILANLIGKYFYFIIPTYIWILKKPVS